MAKTKLSFSHLRPSPSRRPQREESFHQLRARYQRLAGQGEKDWADVRAAGLLDNVPDKWQEYLEIIVASAQDRPTWISEIVSWLPGPDDHSHFSRARRLMITHFTVDLCNQLADAPPAKRYPIYSEIIERLVPTEKKGRTSFSQWREQIIPRLAELPANSADYHLAAGAISVVAALEEDDLSKALKAIFAVDDLFAPGAPFADPLSYRWYHSSFLLVLEKWSGDYSA